MSQLENKPDATRRGRTGVLQTLLSRAWGMLTRNLLLKVFSLFLAILLWSVLIASDSTLTREKTFPSVEVTISGQDALKTRGFIVTDDILALLPSVRVKAAVAQGSYERVLASNFTARVDLSRIRQAGEQELLVTVAPTSSGQVLEIEPSRIMVDVQEYATVGRIPVVVEVVGQAKADLWVDTPRADPILVSVSGPKSVVDRVSRVVAKLDQGLLSSDRVSTRSALHFEPQSADGQSLDMSLLQVSSYDGVNLDTVLVDVSCYPQREIPIDLSSAVQGSPAEGYEVLSVTVEPASIAVAAQKSVLDALSNVYIDTPVNVAEATGTMSGSARIKRIADSKHVSLEEVAITVAIAEQSVERLFRNLSIECVATPEGCTAKLDRAKTNVTLTGGYHWLKPLKDSGVSLYVDLAGLAPGEHVVPVKVRAEGSSEYSYLLDDPMIAVTIAQKSS